MNEWEKCQKRFPHRTSLTEPEKDHLSIAFKDHFAATDQGQRFLFGNLADDIFWSAGPAHPWRDLEDNELITEERLTAGFLDKEYINNLHPLKGTGEYQGKEVKYSIQRNCWTYLNNRTVHFHGTSASETSEEPDDDDTARVEQILERTETTVSSAIQKLQAISRPASPAIRAGSSRTQAPVQASSLPTPPVSKGKAPAPIPPRTRTPTSRSSAPKASTSQGPVQAPPPQPAAPQPPPGPPPPNPPAAGAMAQQNQPRILGTAPDLYDGSPEKASAFWNTLANYYNINDAVYTTDAQKVSSALTYFKIGTPGGNWASDRMKAALDANPVDYGTWNNFKTAFEQQFIPPAAQMEAIQKMHDTWMGSHSFATWFQDWSTHTRRTGVDEFTKMWAFRRNLPPGLQAKLLTLSPQPATLDELVEKAREFDRNWQIFGGSTGNPTRGQGPSRGNWRGNRNPRIQEIKDDTEIEIAATYPRCGSTKKRGKLTQQERQRRMANNLCLYCGTAGHIAAKCPISKRPYMGSSVRQLGTTPEGETSIESQLEDLNINAVTPFNVIDKMIVDSKTDDKPF